MRMVLFIVIAIQESVRDYFEKKRCVTQTKDTGWSLPICKILKGRTLTENTQKQVYLGLFTTETLSYSF